MTHDPYPVPVIGRRSHGMDTEDWQHLAMAYETWTEHVASTDVIDEDLRAFVRDIFSAYGLWNDFDDAPMIDQYLLMFRNRC